MSNTPTTLGIVPVIPSADIERDLAWHQKRTGFTYYFGDSGYTGLRRGDWGIHLQLHRGTREDPMPGGSVVKIFVPDITLFVEEFSERGIIGKDQLRRNTPWGTHEFGFFDLNKNAFFFVQDI